MTEKPILINPFNGLKEKGVEAFVRVHVYVDRESHSMLRRLRPDAGTIQSTFNQLYVKLMNAMHERGITDYTKVDQFVDFVMRSVLVLPEDLTLGPLPLPKKKGKLDERTATRP